MRFGERGYFTPDNRLHSQPTNSIIETQMRFFFVLSLVCYYLANSVFAQLTACPETSSTSPTIQLNVTLSGPGIPNYSGTLLMAFDGNFILILLSVSGVDSPLSAIAGTWSCSSNILTFTGRSFYFLKISMITVTEFTCTYNCGSSNATPNSCSVTYEILSNNLIDTATLELYLVAS